MQRDTVQADCLFSTLSYRGVSHKKGINKKFISEFIWIQHIFLVHHLIDLDAPKKDICII